MAALIVRCTECGKETKGGRIPRGGNGTAMYPRRHNGADGQVCIGSFGEGEWKDVRDREGIEP